MKRTGFDAGEATAAHGSAAATDAVPGVPLPLHENGNSPTTQLEDSYVFLSDGGSSKEEDLYGDGSPDASTAAALQHSPAGARISFGPSPFNY